jgi:hypothetical protein
MRQQHSGSTDAGTTGTGGSSAAGSSATGGSTASTGGAGGASSAGKGGSSTGGTSAGTGGTGTGGSAAGTGGTGTGGTSAGTGGSGTGGTSAGTGGSGTGGTGTGGSAGAGTGGMGGMGGFTVVVTIVLENHDYKEIVGSPNAPYINELIGKGVLATNYRDSNVHPSLPNYLYMVSGKTFVTKDIGPNTSPFPVADDHLGAQLTKAGVPWRAYMESMGTPCRVTDSGPYATRHNPFIYFTSFQSDPTCKTNDVDYGSFPADLAAGKTQFMWITPNVNSDGHDPSTNPVLGLKNSDAWVATEVPKILDSAIFKAGGVLFLTWDEAEGRNGDDPDQIPMIVLSPKVKPGTTSATAFTHASYLATIEDLYGLPRLGAAASAKNMFELFQLGRCLRFRSSCFTSTITSSSRTNRRASSFTGGWPTTPTCCSSAFATRWGSTSTPCIGSTAEPAASCSSRGARWWRRRSRPSSPSTTPRSVTSRSCGAFRRRKASSITPSRDPRTASGSRR